MVPCHPFSGDTGPTFKGALQGAVQQTLFTCCPRYLSSPLVSLAASPERSCSPQQLTVDSVSSLLPGSVAPQGPSHSKRPRDTCFGHPSHRKQHSDQPRVMEKWRQHTKGEQTVLNTIFNIYSSIFGPSDCIFTNLVPSFDEYIVKQNFLPDTSNCTPPCPFPIKVTDFPSTSRSASPEHRNSCHHGASRLPQGSELRGLAAPTSWSHPNCEHTLRTALPQFTQMSCKNITNARGACCQGWKIPLGSPTVRQACDTTVCHCLVQPHTIMFQK